MRIRDWSSDVCSSDLVVHVGGLAGFESAIASDLRYSFSFRAALRVHYVFGFQGWLARELATRFMILMSKRSVAQRLIRFAQTEIRPLMGADATEIGRES